MDSTALGIDYALAMADSVGPQGGLTDGELDGLGERFAQAANALSARIEAGEIGFMNVATDRAALGALRAVHAALHPALRDVLVLGIGGSSLGARALLEALRGSQSLPQPPGSKQPRMHFPDNSDPFVLSVLLERLEPRDTAVLVVSKSGGTVETAAQMSIVRAWLERAIGAEGLRKRWVAITDPKSGSLRATAEREGWLTLPIPPNVGGRFSALTGAGLLPLALAGGDVEGLLGGAAAMAARCLRPELRGNPAGILAAVHYLQHLKKGRSIHVMMPYSDRLRAFAAWYVQLWAESLGKRKNREGQVVESGPTPVPAVGATDQHAQMQLFMEGPRDKLLTFIAVEQSERDLTIPEASGTEAYLSGVALSQLLAAERRGTTEALASDGRPSITLHLPRVDARGMGELLMVYEAATALAGELYGIDPFDQPGVELGKRLAFGLLGRPGYEEARTAIEAREHSRPTKYRV